MVTARVAVIPAGMASFFHGCEGITCNFTHPGRPPLISLTVPIVPSVWPTASSGYLALCVLGMPPVALGALVAVRVLWAVGGHGVVGGGAVLCSGGGAGFKAWL